MLRIIVDKDQVFMVEVRGTGIEIVTDLVYVLNRIYAGLNDKQAKAFKDSLLLILNDPNSPVWTKDDPASTSDKVIPFPEGRS